MRAISDQRLWEDIADGLRALIDSGEYGPGQTLPSETELAREYNVSRDTVRRALSKLTEQGLLTSGRGRKGRSVRTSDMLTFHAARSESGERLAERRTRGVDAWLADAADQGRAAGQEITVSISQPPDGIARRLELGPGDLICTRHRLRTIDGAPHNLNDTIYPRWISQGTLIENPADIPQGVIAYMAELGYTQVRYNDEVTSRMPTPAEVERLAIPPGVPVIVQMRTGYTTERPVKVTVTVWPGDRSNLIYEVGA